MTSVREIAPQILKMTLTALLALLAAFVLWHIYTYYTYAPQTRDGKIRADVIPLAADVSGRVASVLVHDDEHVRRGELLFTVDRVRLANAVERAKATLATAKATLDSAERENRRYQKLRGVVPEQELADRESAAKLARAQYAQAVADLDLAQINLERSQVRAPANGIVTNFQLRAGDYATTGQAVMALVDSDSFYVAGYFEETKLARIHVGDKATIRVMGYDHPLRGHVAGISAGINDSERSTTAGTLLANVNPTFNWVRLAQRVPVRVAIDKVPAGFDLVAGRTVTVTLDGTGGPFGIRP